MRTAYHPPHTHTHSHTQEQAWLVVAPKAGRKKKTEQARRRRISDPFPLSRLTLRISSSRVYTLVHSPIPSLHRKRSTTPKVSVPSFHRTTRSSLATRSSACSKSPTNFSTRTSRPQQQWRRRSRCGRRAGHTPCMAYVVRPALPYFAKCGPIWSGEIYTHASAAREFIGIRIGCTIGCTIGFIGSRGLHHHPCRW